MSLRSRVTVALIVLTGLSVRAQGEPAKVPAVDGFFVNEVWPKVGARTCLECHKPDGDAEDSDFVLIDPAKPQGRSDDEVVRQNRDTFARMARSMEGDQSRLLLKPLGKVHHGGKQVLKPESTGFHVLAEYVRRLREGPSAEALAKADAAAKDQKPFYDGIVMIDDARLLRRVTLSLAGRLPTDAELATMKSGGSSAMAGLIDGVMREDAFYDRIREAFNDVFLTAGVDGNPDQSVLSYEHFNKTRGWAEYGKFEEIKDPKERQQYKYKVAREYRQALLLEPMKLVEHIVREGRPFTEILTADYIMVSPYSARGYGIFEELKSQFKNPDDPFEFIPVRLKALVGRSKDTNQESATGFYPHAGILSTFQYLARYPTTETNRNRARARMFYQHFLGVDVLELAARVQDAAAVQAKYPVPTMQASECVVCHKTLDPVAGCFQDYWVFADKGIYGRRKGGWFTDMFAAGFEGETLPPDQRWRALQWLAERTVKDPRFANAMVEHAYYVLTGRKALLAPKDVDDPMFAARRRAYLEQRKQVEAIAREFIASNYDFKVALRGWAMSSWYRADAVASTGLSPERRAELEDVGLSHLLSPEQLERNLKAIFGQPWGKLRDPQMAMLYGGIDSKEVTERASDPSGAMGAIQRIMSNDMACRHTAYDFSREPADRLLFPRIEPDVVPGASADGDAKIRAAIVHLHRQILGREDAADSAEVTRTFELFAGIVDDAKAKKLEPTEAYSCRQKLLKPVPDPHYTVRAWRAVVTYLLRREEFLYE